ncbi:MAG: hypothetical protein NUV59_00640 [Patescibacteria group bacterium]|nr:hypothetical protein [Patescibacteria group bacterium]
MNTAELESRLADGAFRVALVGMSNVGKTRSARALARERGFAHTEVDARIMRELGLSGIDALAEWLGFPGSEGYAERERKYLDMEEKHTLAASDAPDGIVLDTTGSVVHLGDEMLDKMRSDFLVVHLDVGDEPPKALIERYFSVPKPVVWGGHFSMNDGEEMKDALVRCYPELLRERLKRYRDIAHVNIPSGEIDTSDAGSIISAIRSRLVSGE